MFFRTCKPETAEPAPPEVVEAEKRFAAALYQRNTIRFLARARGHADPDTKRVYPIREDYPALEAAEFGVVGAEVALREAIGRRRGWLACGAFEVRAARSGRRLVERRRAV